MRCQFLIIRVLLDAQLQANSVNLALHTPSKTNGLRDALNLRICR